jgi:ABC-type transport system involved in multi-copper enzyme maturation permease subunit
VSRAWLIAKKDIREAFARHAVIYRAVVPAILLPLLYGAITGLTIRHAQQGAKAALAMSGQIPFFAAIVALIGSLLAVMITADAIAGEKERRTIETLFATPASDLEIFAGKVLAAFLPAMGVGYAGGILYLVTARLLAGGQPLPAPAVAGAAKLVAMGVPLITAMLSAAGVIISARCGTVTNATQLSGLATLPIGGGIIYIAFRINGWSGWQLLLLAGLIALCVLLMLLGARALGREEIIARID